MRLIKILVVLALVAGAVFFIVQHKNKADADRIAAEAKAAAESTKTTVSDAVAAGTQAVNKVVTNVASDFKEGMQKAEDMATNIAGKTKQVTTNVISKAADITTNIVDQAKQTFQGLAH